MKVFQKICLNFIKYYFVGKRKGASFLSCLFFKMQNTSTSLSVTKKFRKGFKNKAIKILSQIKSLRLKQLIL